MRFKVGDIVTAIPNAMSYPVGVPGRVFKIEGIYVWARLPDGPESAAGPYVITSDRLVLAKNGIERALEALRLK